MSRRGKRESALVLVSSALLALAVLWLGAGSATRAAELVLKDGRVIAGVDIERDGPEYVVRLDNGGAISIPVELVQEVRLTGRRAPDPPVPTGLTYAEPGPFVPSGPTGLRQGEPMQLAGQAVTPPDPSGQLAVFGEPAQFQQNIVDNDWVPTTDWDMRPEVMNNWARSTWAENVIDPEWHPESAFDPNEDVLEDSRSTWEPSIIDNSWTPTDGFPKR